MKAYIIKCELIDSEPLIWRRVIMPADATFARLHTVIQCITNFQSGFPLGDYHLYEFELKEEGLLVTNDEEARQEHLKLKVSSPSSLKIDAYLEKYKAMTYGYDFGDGWLFKVSLEDVVEDYYFGYPTLLDGAETAPPEDVGGLGGFYRFLSIYNDKNDEEHEEMVVWAKSQGFAEYNPDDINDRLKACKYKKTEWDKINHNRYRIIEDKYRKK